MKGSSLLFRSVRLIKIAFYHIDHALIVEKILYLVEIDGFSV
jgi:hypothetical protein